MSPCKWPRWIPLRSRWTFAWLPSPANGNRNRNSARSLAMNALTSGRNTRHRHNTAAQELLSNTNRNGTPNGIPTAKPNMHPSAHPDHNRPGRCYVRRCKEVLDPSGRGNHAVIPAMLLLLSRAVKNIGAVSRGLH
jgi:hypothetical protein